VLEKSCKRDMVISGFSATGIFPLNVNAINPESLQIGSLASSHQPLLPTIASTNENTIATINETIIASTSISTPKTPKARIYGEFYAKR